MNELRKVLSMLLTTAKEIDSRLVEGSIITDERDGVDLDRWHLEMDSCRSLLEDVALETVND